MPSITVPHWQLIRALQRARTVADKTLEDAAKELGIAASGVNRLERGLRRPKPPEVRTLGELYGLSDEEIRRLTDLAKLANQPGWWQPYRVRETYGTYIALENDARAVWNYQTIYVPGLVQTEDYARAIIRTSRPPEEVDRLVDVRMKRQERLARPDDPPLLHLIMDEAALRREVGDRDVMTGQIRRLHELSLRPNITVQVIPFTSGVHPGMRGPFVILDFATDASLPSVVYTESVGGDAYLEGEEDVRQFTRTYGQLRSIALSPTETQRMITDLIE